MATVEINNFGGGHAQDVRTFDTDKCEECLNFDIYTNPHQLIPIRDNVTGTLSSGAVTMAQVQIADVVTQVVGGASRLVAQGKTISGGGVLTTPDFYYATSMNGDWTNGGPTTGTGTFTPQTMVTYKDNAYLVSKSANDYLLIQYVSSGTATTRVTLTPATASGGNSYPVPKPFVHPEDNILYYVVGNAIGRWDGTTATTSTTILPLGMCATSLTDYGTYLAIGMKSLNGVAPSVTYLWGRDMTINTLQGIIPFGEGSLNVLENIGNDLVGLVAPRAFGTSTINYKLDVKVYSGGVVTTVKSIPLTSFSSGFNIIKCKSSDKLYFAIGGTETAIYAVYKNKEGFWVCTKERYLYNGSTSANDTVATIVALSVVGDYFYMGFIDTGGTYRMRQTSISADYTFTSKYKTTINPNMPLEDRYKDKTLEAVQISYTGNAGTNSIAFKYSVDASTMTSVIAESNKTGEGVLQATMQADGQVLLSGKEFQFQVETTGGVKIKEIKYKYSIINSVI